MPIRPWDFAFVGVILEEPADTQVIIVMKAQDDGSVQVLYGALGQPLSNSVVELHSGAFFSKSFKLPSVSGEFKYDGGELILVKPRGQVKYERKYASDYTFLKNTLTLEAKKDDV